MSIEKVNHSDLKEVILEAHKVRIPLFIHGTFGIGKSDSVKAVGKIITNNINSEIKDEKKHLKYSEDFEDSNSSECFMTRVIPAHQLDAGDLKGLPFPNKDHTMTTFLQTDYLPTAGQGILFFDELKLAPPMIQANLYQIILDRRLGKYRVPTNYTCIAAGNMEEDRSHSFSMALPLKNRFIHVELKTPMVEDWINDYALSNGIDHRIMSFLKGQEGLLHNYKPELNLDDEDLTAIATPRTWSFLSKIISSITPGDKESPDGNYYKKLNIMSNATVGCDVGNQFVAWLKMSLNYDVHKIYKTGVIDKKPTAVDQQWSLASALLSYYLKVPANDKAKKEEIAVKYAKLAKDFFPKEHTVLMMAQAKAIDKDWLGFLKSDAVLYKGIVADYTKLLI